MMENQVIMMENQEELVDKKIYKQASKRVAFKFHFAIYILAIALLWLIFAFIFKEVVQFRNACIFVTLSWTPIIIFHYVMVYKFNHSLLDKEIKKLQREMKEKEAELERLKIMKNKQEN